MSANEQRITKVLLDWRRLLNLLNGTDENVVFISPESTTKSKIGWVAYTAGHENQPQLPIGNVYLQQHSTAWGNLAFNNKTRAIMRYTFSRLNSRDPEMFGAILNSCDAQDGDCIKLYNHGNPDEEHATYGTLTRCNGSIQFCVDGSNCEVGNGRTADNSIVPWRQLFVKGAPARKRSSKRKWKKQKSMAMEVEDSTPALQNVAQLEYGTPPMAAPTAAPMAGLTAGPEAAPQAAPKPFPLIASMVDVAGAPGTMGSPMVAPSPTLAASPSPLDPGTLQSNQLQPVARAHGALVPGEFSSLVTGSATMDAQTCAAQGRDVQAHHSPQITETACTGMELDGNPKDGDSALEAEDVSSGDGCFKLPTVRQHVEDYLAMVQEAIRKNVTPTDPGRPIVVEFFSYEAPPILRKYSKGFIASCNIQNAELHIETQLPIGNVEIVLETKEAGDLAFHNWKNSCVRLAMSIIRQLNPDKFRQIVELHSAENNTVIELRSKKDSTKSIYAYLIVRNDRIILKVELCEIDVGSATEDLRSQGPIMPQQPERVTEVTVRNERQAPKPAQMAPHALSVPHCVTLKTTVHCGRLNEKPYSRNVGNLHVFLFVFIATIKCLRSSGSEPPSEDIVNKLILEVFRAMRACMEFEFVQLEANGTSRKLSIEEGFDCLRCMFHERIRTKRLTVLPFVGFREFSEPPFLMQRLDELSNEPGGLHAHGLDMPQVGEEEQNEIRKDWITPPFTSFFERRINFQIPSLGIPLRLPDCILPLPNSLKEMMDDFAPKGLWAKCSSRGGRKRARFTTIAGASAVRGKGKLKLDELPETKPLIQDVSYFCKKCNGTFPMRHEHPTEQHEGKDDA